MISTPIKRNGSKASIGRIIADLAPPGYQEFREAFCGSCSTLPFIRDDVPRWYNDADWRLIRCLKWLRDEPKSVDAILRVKARMGDATEAYRQYCRARNGLGKGDPLAIVILSRFSYRQHYSVKRRNIASFGFAYLGSGGGSGWNGVTRESLDEFRNRLQGVKLTAWDYSRVLEAPGRDCWLFLDPPWGNRRDHYEHHFNLDDHLILRDRLRVCPHKWLMSLGMELEDLYPPDEFIVLKRTYRACHSWRKPGSITQELLIRNYDF